MPTLAQVESVSAGVPDTPIVADAAFVPIGPIRVTDTRASECGCDMHIVDEGFVHNIDVGLHAEVPAGATAVALSITVAGSEQAGFLTAYTGGTDRPEVSNLNWRRGELRTNSAIVALGIAAGAVGRIAIFTSTDADVMVDVSGAFLPLDRHPDPGGGRFIPHSPTRAFDSRPSPVPAGIATRVPLPAGVPLDAVAIAANFTVIPTSAAGFLTAGAVGSPLPDVSQATFSHPGFASASSAIVPVSGDGLDLMVSTDADVIVDVTGWFTREADPAHQADDGLLTLVAPDRLFDSRERSELIYDQGTIDVASAPAFDPDARVGAIVGNVTLVGPAADTYLSVYQAGSHAPETSTVNARAGSDVAAATLIAPSTSGIRLLSQRTTHALVDVFGYFSGTPLPDAGVAASNPPPPGSSAAMDALVRRLAARSSAVSVTVRRSGDLVYHRAEGRTVSGADATPDTPMMQASVSKVVTALTIARLDQLGLVDLDAPVPWDAAGFTPNAAWNSVTLRDLIEHRSGMPVAQSSWFVASSGTCRTVVVQLIANSPRSTRGSRSYSNGNYCVLGEVIEAVTGERYDAAAYRYVFDPLDIEGPHLSRDGLRHDDAPHTRAMNTRNLVGAAGQWLISSDDVAVMLDNVSSADMDVLGGTAFAATWESPYGGFGHTGTLTGAKACAWVINGFVVSAVIAGEAVTNGATLCRTVMPVAMAAFYAA